MLSEGIEMLLCIECHPEQVVPVVNRSGMAKKQFESMSTMQLSQ